MDIIWKLGVLRCAAKSAEQKDELKSALEQWIPGFLMADKRVNFTPLRKHENRGANFRDNPF